MAQAHPDGGRGMLPRVDGGYLLAAAAPVSFFIAVEVLTRTSRRILTTAADQGSTVDDGRTADGPADRDRPAAAGPPVRRSPAAGVPVRTGPPPAVTTDRGVVTVSDGRTGRRTGPAGARTAGQRTVRHHRAGTADRTGQTADRSDLEAAARTTHARLAATGVALTRQTLTEGLRRDGHPVSNATAGQLLTVLRTSPDGGGRTVVKQTADQPADQGRVPDRTVGDQPTSTADRSAHRPGTGHGPPTG